MFFRILAMACFALSIVQAQDIQYVSAENGLVMRKQPNQGATKVGVLDYGAPVEIIEYTDLNLDVKDKNKKISGKWVKIKGSAEGEYFENAYVFNGYLTEEKIERPLKISFHPFTVYIDKLSADVELAHTSAEDDAPAIFKVIMDKSPENRYLKIKHHEKHRAIEVFQRYRNSMAITSKEGHTHLSDFQHYVSSWKPLKLLYTNGNIFKTIAFTDKDSKQFGDINRTDLKAYLKTQNSASYNIVQSQIELKVIMTSIDGYKYEKIIIFELPLKG